MGIPNATQFSNTEFRWWLDVGILPLGCTVFLRQVRVWIWPTPQLLHRARDVLTATPQPVQGNVPQPLASRALWTLQYSPRQLFPHTSTVPNSSQAQLFVPFIVMLRYTLVYKCLIGEWPPSTFIHIYFLVGDLVSLLACILLMCI